MSIFERYLSLWVLACIAVGVVLGDAYPALFEGISLLNVAQVNIPVAVLIWLMIIPMLLKVDFSKLHDMRQHWKGIGITLFINWGVKPFSMAFLAWVFIRVLFVDRLPADQIDSYISRVDLVGGRTMHRDGFRLE